MATALAIAAVVFLFSSFYIYHSRSTQDPREPPLAQTAIPFVGHVIGILRSKFNYFVQLSQRIKHDVFTIHMLGQKTYVVTTPEMIQAIQKQPKVFAFPPIEVNFTHAVCGTSPEAHEILLKNLYGDEGDWGFAMESHTAMREALRPGPDLDAMNRVMTSNVTEFLDNLQPATGQKRRIWLVKWLRYNVTLATTNSVYGSKNPYKDDAIIDAFWDYEADLMKILMGFLPSVMARKGISGRAKVSQAFEKYYEQECHKDASALVRKRYETSIRNGVSIADIARYELVASVAALINTAPAVFWMVFFVFSQTNLLTDIRAEIDPMIVTSQNHNGSTIRMVDITNLKQNCPLLTSTLQETLRFRSVGTSARQVMKDTVLQNKWLLKKDSLIQMPSRVVHLDREIWGSTADSFEPRRFMKNSNLKGPGGKRPSPAAFRAFGGGSTLCSGRHFATNEILVVVVMFLLRFDMVPVSGEWKLPTVDNTDVTSVIMEPDTDFEVEVQTRKGFEGGEWNFVLNDSEKIFAVVSEDQAT